MENSGGTVPSKQGTFRRGAGTPAKDLLSAVRNGSVHDVEVALLALKKSNGNVDTRNGFGSTALHVAVWRNHIPIVRRLLAAGANPDARDGESGWSSLHRALHFGHLAVSGVLIEAGASLILEDTKGRTPVDLLSGPVQQCIEGSANAGLTEVYSWGNGFNYQLGTGTSGIQRKPCRIDNLAGLDIKCVAAAKFHSVSLSASGCVYSWGFGRGGRLGHPDFDVHSGQVAVITPRQVISGLGARCVTVVAVAKHHSIVSTDSGEVYTWGSNREGQLGYPAVDTQPTPRKVTALKARVVKVAASNKHSAVLTDSGEIFTWGCNTEGQLGYGTSNSSANFVPRCVEYLKGKNLISLSCSKYHTVVLGSEGEVYNWGYKMVTPRRVVITRNTKKGGNLPLKFHRAERLHIVAIAAGTTHSSAISEDGLIFYWASGDQNLRCHQLLAMSGHQAVAIAAGKYRTSVVTADGSVFIWDGEYISGHDLPSPIRVHGIKHATGVSVGENHSLVIASLFTPVYPPETSNEKIFRKQVSDVDDGSSERDEEEIACFPEVRCKKLPHRAPSLKDLCQDVIIGSMVEPKNVLHLFEIADAVGADNLRRYCEDLVLRNLGYILTMSSSVFGQLRPALLAELEKSLDSSSVQDWSYRRLPTPSATLPAVIDSEEEECDIGVRVRGISGSDLAGQLHLSHDKRVKEDNLSHANVIDEGVLKQIRAIRKKLQQIQALEFKLANGETLDDQQHAKLQTRQELEESLFSLETGSVLPKSGHEQEEAGKVQPVENVSIRNTEDGQHRRRTGKKKTRSLNEPPKKDEKLNNQVAQMEVPSDAFKDTTELDCWGDAKGRLLQQCSLPRDEGVYEVSQIAPVLGFSSESTRKVTQVGKSDTGMPLIKKKVKKGGLSMFLSGALEAPPKVIVARADGPAWGGAKVSKVQESLREIQTKQTAESTVPVVADKSSATRGNSGTSGMKSGASLRRSASSDNLAEELKSAGKRVQWAPFVRPTDPISMAPVAAAVPKTRMESSPPPWSGSLSGPAVPSLRDIQLEQGKHKSSLRGSNPWGSPQLNSPFGSIHGAAGGSQHLDSPGTSTGSPNRWFKPDQASPSSLRCIQIEEQAMKELRRFYKDLKLVERVDS